MNSERVNDWLQLVGMAAVVASLLFVGLQLKQSQEIAIAAQYQAGFLTEEAWHALKYQQAVCESYRDNVRCDR